MSIDSILSRPLNFVSSDGAILLGSEMGILRLLQEGNEEGLRTLLKKGLNPNSKITHSKYLDFSLLKFLIACPEVDLKNKLNLMDALLESGATVTRELVDFGIRRLSLLQIEVLAMLVFSLPKSEWEDIINSCENSVVKEKLGIILTTGNLFTLLQRKYFALFRSACRVCCHKQQDIFSLGIFDINDEILEKNYTLLHFSSYHLSQASANKEESKSELEKVVRLLLKLGADPSKTTQEGSSTGGSSRPFSSLSLLSAGYVEPSGAISPVQLHEEFLEGCVKSVLMKHPLDGKGEPLSEEEASRAAKRAAPALLSKTVGKKRKAKIEYN